MAVPLHPQTAPDGASTLADVASRAGVSLATASRVLNGTGSAGRRVTEALADRVTTAAKALDYSPNAHAQAMARGRSDSLGLVVHDIADPYFYSIASAVIAAAAARGLLVSVASTQRDPAAELQYIEQFRQQRAQVVVLAGSRVDDVQLLDGVRSGLRAFVRGGGRAACIGQDALGIGAVVVENRLGAADLARSLHGIGYRRFGVLAGPTQHVTARDRTEGFCYSLTELDAAPRPELIVACPFTRAGGYAAMVEILERHSGRMPVDCLFAVNDVMALGALAALREAGLAVPDDVALAGFDDIPSLLDVVPDLTTVRLPMTRIGTEVVELALEVHDGVPRRTRISGSVVLRASTPVR